MGNSKSQPPGGLDLEQKPFLSSSHLTMHKAIWTGIGNVTIFRTVPGSESAVLVNFAKNLKIHRHPNILKYVGSWSSGSGGGSFYLATEDVVPLSSVVTKQTSLQICIGLHSILKAIQFLHEKAESSHNNISQAAIYVTQEGNWKLGGFEYLCRFSDLSVSFLSESRPRRYDRGVSPGEESRVPQPPSSIDVYAFGVLVDEVVNSRNADVPGLADFTNLCRTALQAPESKSRPLVSTLLDHKYFNHEFIRIQNFLVELPLKTDNEKQLFFRDLSSKLSEFEEDVVASLLATLLLCRIVLLDNTAQRFLIPQILVPKFSSESESIFSEAVFKEFIVPKLLSMFCVRDLQVRLTLLKYFKFYCRTFSTSELNSRILPELLVGIKDTNDELVAATLKALACLVPVLGSSTVIGGKRAKFFSDGRPKVNQVTKSSKKSRTSIKMMENEVEETKDLFLAERPSPDGGEAPSTPTVTEEEETEIEPWDNWDVQPPLSSVAPELNVTSGDIPFDLSSLSEPSVISVAPTIVDKATEAVPLVEEKDESDFFRDMEPVIVKTEILRLDSEKDNVEEKCKFQVMNDEEAIVEEGWGDETDWADVSDTAESVVDKI